MAQGCFTEDQHEEGDSQEDHAASAMRDFVVHESNVTPNGNMSEGIFGGRFPHCVHIGFADTGPRVMLRYAPAATGCLCKSPNSWLFSWITAREHSHASRTHLPRRRSTFTPYPRATPWTTPWCA